MRCLVKNIISIYKQYDILQCDILCTYISYINLVNKLQQLEHPYEESKPKID